MKFLKFIRIVLLMLVVSMFVYPVGLSILPSGLNTKMALGLVGIIAYILESIRKKEALFHTTTVVALLFALVFSVWCYFSMVANGTPDDSYATYFMSFAVWLGGAYAVCALIKGAHGKINLAILVQYMAAAGVFQCVMALLIDDYPGVRGFVDTYVQQGQDFLKKVDRLYGVGAALDPGGCRFAVTLVLLSHMISTDEKLISSKFQLSLALGCFFVITLIGNMISRTTTAGAVLGLGYIFIRLWTTRRGIFSREKLRFYGIFLSMLAVVVVYSIFKYQADLQFRDNLRFAFEAFFNFFEQGVFRTDSTDKLQNTMWVWPDNLHDWTIGTGWFGFYVYATDIGYCRFILYCGVVGLALFTSFFFYNAFVVIRKFDDFGIITFLLIVLMFVIWVKVATDIFWVYALLICLPEDRKEDELESEIEE